MVCQLATSIVNSAKRFKDRGFLTTMNFIFSPLHWRGIQWQGKHGK